MKTNLFLLVLVYGVFSAMPSGDTVTNYAGLKFKRIPAGSFMMGFEEGDTLKGNYVHLGYGDSLKFGMYDEHPQHQVAISRDFYMGIKEVTIADYVKFNPNLLQRYGTWDPKGTGCPAYKISWKEAVDYCAWLTANDTSGYYYRLPTEAEWEYCCRAGTDAFYYTGDTISGGWLNYNIGYGTSVKWTCSYPPNPWGLYDMLGNAEEWCLDWYGPYRSGAQIDPAGFQIGDFRVCRGSGLQQGSDFRFWNRCAVRCAWYGDSIPESTISYMYNDPKFIGFRVVLTALHADSLLYHPPFDTQYSWQRNVSPARPAPLTTVSGETWTDPEGREFIRTRLADIRSLVYPSQKDSIIYVCAEALSGDSAATRQLAGLYARNRAVAYGVLYRISNRYELFAANVLGEAGRYYLTIVPDINHVAGMLHPDVAYKKDMVGPGVSAHQTGPVYTSWNHGPSLSELPNGDLMISWFTCMHEESPTMNNCCSRMRFGDTVWSAVGPEVDIPGRQNHNGFWSSGDTVFMGLGQGYRKFSLDNGATFGWGYKPGAGPCTSTDSLFQFTDYGYSRFSTDCGYTWTTLSGPLGWEITGALKKDDGSILAFARKDGSGNGELNGTMTQYDVYDRGREVRATESPFTVMDAPGSHPAQIKLHSGRALTYALNQNNSNKIIAESVDSGRTWFCRAFSYASGYTTIMQTRSGIIYVIGSGQAGIAWDPIMVFTEQWLREQALKPVSVWGVNTADKVSDGSVTEPDYFSTLPPAGIGAARPVGANNYSPLQLTASPNPFNPSTVIRYSLPAGQGGALSILNVQGEVVFTTALKGASGRIRWDGQGFPSGLYVARLAGQGGFERTLKILLVK